MINPPSLQQLKYLIAVAETRHFGRAAEACFVTQSTLSAGLQELETRLGAPLVERRKRGALLTALGQQVVERARHILSEAESLVELARATREPLLLLQDGHCLRDHALAACNLMNRRGAQPFQATSLPTLIQMVDNGIGTTLLPAMAVAGGALKGTHIVTRPLTGTPTPSRSIGLAWRKASPRRDEFRLLGRDIIELSKKAGLTDID